MSTHQQVLEILDRRWIDMGGGRQSLAKRKLPPHAYDPSPCVFVQALPEDSKPQDVGAQFIGKCHKHRRYHWGQVPTTLAWHVVAPTGETYFIHNWPNWDKHTVPLFQEFCEQTGRPYGFLTPERMIDLGPRKVSFFDCELIHEDDIKPGQPTVKEVTAAGQNVVETARRLLRARKTAIEELEYEEFRNDAAAHDDALHERLRRQFVRRLKAVQKQLAAEFGKPDETGSDDRDDIPRNGVFQLVIWRRNKKALFLAAQHEDRELPYVLVMGTI